MLNSFKIHDENAVPSHKPANLLQKPLSLSNSSSSSSGPLKNQKVGLAPRKALGDISANKLNTRAVQSDLENVGPLKPTNSRLGDVKPVSKAPNFKIIETSHSNQHGPVMKASSAASLSLDDTEDIDIVS